MEQQCPKHGVYHTASEYCPECGSVSPVDMLLRRSEPVGVFVDLQDHPGLRDQLDFHGIDAGQIVYFLGLLVAGELEHHPYKSAVAP